eukprot:TRINITY_DN69224_c0_g1_i1.p1 TRINITY_DN69224_c0_g1~~TRINITY_DN69224_c0_g1_i1.p1  ORF type:complete len:603 (+),score=77.89 TRINITY_DN69224_c0_g1_i1:89-1897(+)
MQLAADVHMLVAGFGAYCVAMVLGFVIKRLRRPRAASEEPESKKSHDEQQCDKVNAMCVDASDVEMPDPSLAEARGEPEAEGEPEEMVATRAGEFTKAGTRWFVVAVMAAAFVSLLALRRCAFGNGERFELELVDHGTVESITEEAEMLAHSPDMRSDNQPVEDADQDTLWARNAQAQPTVWNGEVVSMKLTRQKAVEKIERGVLTEYVSAYYGTLRIGSGMDSFTVLLDTGSANLILPSTFCSSSTCRKHNRYAPSRSRTAVGRDSDGQEVFGSARDELTVDFGTGSASGVFVEDVVCAGDAVANVSSSDALPLGCSRFNVIAATEMSAHPFDTFAFDGVLGLGLPLLSYTPEFNLMHMLGKHMNMPQKFGLFLAHGSGSELSFGGMEAGHLEQGESSLAWVDVASPELGHWIVKLESLRVDDHTLDFCNDDCYAVFDSGTALMSVPGDAFVPLYHALWHEAGLDGECRGSAPTWQFNFRAGSGTATLSLGAAEFSRAQIYSKPKPARFGQTITDNRTIRSDMFCRPLLMTVDMGEPMPPKLFILGEPALQKFYTVYDLDSKRIGFGRAKQELPRSIETHYSESENDDWFFDEDQEEDASV